MGGDHGWYLGKEMDGDGHGLCEGTVGAVISKDNLSQSYE